MNEKKYFYIYKIINKINNKIYIGQHRHVKLNNSYLGSGVNIIKAIKKYGKDNFKKDILEVCLNCPHHLAYRERYYIDKYNSTDNTIGYNLSIGGETYKGCSLSEETKLKISLNHHDVSGKNNPRYNIKLSEETKKKISEANKGKLLGIKRGNMPEEIKKKISNSKLGKKLSEEHKRKISEGGKGRIMSEENKENLRLKNTNSKHREEAKLKMSLANKNREFKTCPYCGKSSQSYTNLNRFHFNNCLFNPNLTEEDILILKENRKFPNTGKTHSKETKEKIRLSKLGKPAWNKNKKLINNHYE